MASFLFFSFVSVPSKRRPTGRDKLRHGKRIERKEPVGFSLEWQAIIVIMIIIITHRELHAAEAGEKLSFLFFSFSFLLFFLRGGGEANITENRLLIKKREGNFWTREKKREKNNGIVCCGLSVHKTNRRVISSRSSAF
jgi:hypothetical protein